MKSANVGDRYIATYAGCRMLVEVVRVIENSESYENRWDFVCLVKEVGGDKELLRRVSELRPYQ